MSNMSYVRFENTAADLEDCLVHINTTGLSASEEDARDRLVELCRDILDAYEKA